MRNVCDYGARGDGVTKDTRSIQSAIDATAASGGGTVHVPPGTYLTGTLFLRSHITLHLEAGATLLGSPDRADYNADDCFPENNVFACEKATGGHLLIAYRCRNVAITGEGCIDGNSLSFFDSASCNLSLGNMACRAAGEHFDIPSHPGTRLGQMIQFTLCENVQLRGVRLCNPSYWTLFLHGCRAVRIDGLSIENPPQTPNGDGIDIDCCERVTVSNCIIKTSDDCITLRANETPLGGPFPCRDITVTNCVLSSRCNAIRIGVGNGTISHCLFSNIAITDTRTGISINASIPCLDFSCAIAHVRFSDIQMDVRIPLYMVNSEGTAPLRPGAGIRDIVLSGIQGTATAGFLASGMPGLPLANITFREIGLELVEGSDNRVFQERGVPYPVDGHWGSAGYETIPCGLYIRNAERVLVEGCSFSWTRPGAGWLDAVQCVNVGDLSIVGGLWRTPHPDRGAAVRVRACRNVGVQQVCASSGMHALLAVEDMPQTEVRCSGLPS